MARYGRYFGIDYSGANTAEAPLAGIRLYGASPGEPAVEIPPPASSSRSKHWSRRALAAALCDALSEGPPTLVGIDHGFSFPCEYFDLHGIAPDWDAFLSDFCHHWPSDSPGIRVQAIRDGLVGNGLARGGSSRWRRLAEQRCGAKSVFHFDVQGSVAKSTHAGIPWLATLRTATRGKVHFWPFDGWHPPRGRSVVCEIYPSLHARGWSRDGRDAHQHDAWVAASWLRDVDADGSLDEYFTPELSSCELQCASMEGWILGVR